jgi:adenosine deaminase
MHVSMNTDDRGYFSATAEGELPLVFEHRGVDARGPGALQRRAMAAAFAPPEVRRLFEAELSAWEAEWAGL